MFPESSRKFDLFHMISGSSTFLNWRRKKKNIQKYSIHHPNPSLRAAGLFLCQALEGDPILHGQVGYGGIVAGGIHQ
jgi:hypothetical protein